MSILIMHQTSSQTGKCTLRWRQRAINKRPRMLKNAHIHEPFLKCSYFEYVELRYVLA